MNHKESSNSAPSSTEAVEAKVACEVCLTEVPTSGTKSEETSDYVAHFCGLECYDKWRKDQSDES